MWHFSQEFNDIDRCYYMAAQKINEIKSISILFFGAPWEILPHKKKEIEF